MEKGQFFLGELDVAGDELVDFGVHGKLGGAPVIFNENRGKENKFGGLYRTV